MSTFIRSLLVATVLAGSVSVASAAPTQWNPDKFFDEMQNAGA